MNRVLSLLPSATEIIYELGADDMLVGVTHECDYPEAARAKPRLTSAKIDPSMASDRIDELVRQQLEDGGTLYMLDMDLLQQIRPDLVLTQQLCTVCAVGYATVHAAMRALPQPPEVVNLEPNTLDDVIRTIVDVGEYLDLRERAVERAAALRARLAAIPPLPERPRLLFLEWLIPPFSAGHWIAELIEAAGAIPMLANPDEYSRQLAWETIGAARFDTLVISCCGFNVERATQDLAASDELQALLAERPGLELFVFDGNHFFSRPGPRLIESAELLNRALAGVPPGDAGATVPDPYRTFGAAEIAAMRKGGLMPSPAGDLPIR